MLSVLHVVPAVAARYGGPSAAIFGMCRALDAAGVATLVAATDADGPGRLDVPLEHEIVYQGAKCIFFPRRFTESYKWAVRLGAWLRGHVAEFDVVHIHAVFSHSSLLAGRACMNAGVPYIVRPLGTLDPWSVEQKRLQKIILLRLGTQRMLVNAAAMHYTSPEEMRLAEGVVSGLPRGEVVPLGIDEDLFEQVNQRPADEAPSVLALSRLAPKKGIDLLIAAFHEAAGRGPNDKWRLVIAGDGEPAYVATLRALASGGEASARITFTGWVGAADKAALFRSASLYALPSHQENFGISMVEAMACGVPALVTPGVNLADQIASSGAGWVAERNTPAIAGALKTAMSDPIERGRRGQAGRQLAGQYRWPAVAHSLDQLYRAVVSTRRAAAPRALRSMREPAAH